MLLPRLLCVPVGLAIALTAPPVSGQPASVPADASRGAALKPDEYPRLIVGDPAPPLQIADWVKGGPIEIETGRFYVIDFWATWCVPCMVSMPDTSELSRAYRDRNVTFVAVTAGDEHNTLERVREVVAHQGDQMDFAVAFDNGLATTQAYRARARRSAIPCCFVIDAQSRIAWVGHPGDLKPVLTRVVAGDWSIAEARAEHLRAVDRQDLETRTYRAYNEAIKADRWEEVIGLAPRLLECSPRYGFVIGDSFDAMLIRLKDPDRAADYARLCVSDIARDDGPTLSRIAWTIVNDPGVPRRDLDIALLAAQRAVETDPDSNPYIFRAAAAVWFAKGEAPTAIELQRKGLAICEPGSPLEAQMRELLEMYSRAK
jgi:thiol-disulfide isomerase/thioredoxin